MLKRRQASRTGREEANRFACLQNSVQTYQYSYAAAQLRERLPNLSPGHSLEVGLARLLQKKLGNVLSFRKRVHPLTLRRGEDDLFDYQWAFDKDFLDVCWTHAVDEIQHVAVVEVDLESRGAFR